jgi:hypothetical protein
MLIDSSNNPKFSRDDDSVIEIEHDAPGLGKTIELTPTRSDTPAQLAAAARLRHHQLYIDVAARCIGIRTDDVGFLYQGFHLLAR